MRAKAPLYLRGSIWWCRVHTRQGVARRSTKCRDYRAAVAVWREFERDGSATPDRTEDETFLHDALASRIEERRAAGRASGTLSMLGVKSRQLLRVFGADCTLANVTAETVDRFIATRLREGASRSTVHKELTTLRGALKLARRHGRFPRDVASVMPLDFSIRYKPRERALSFSEIDRLLGELTPPKRAIVAFLLATGATYPSELANLRRSDVDLETWSVRLRGTKRASRDRTVPIVPWAREWVGLAMPHLPFARWTNIRRDLHQACDRARIGRVSPNDLRRTAATLLRTAGIEPHLIGRFLGHGDSRMAERVYGRLRDETFADLLESRLAMSTKRAQFSEKPSKKAEK